MARISKQERRRRLLRRSLIGALAAAVAITGAVLYFRSRVEERFASGEQEEVLEGAVELGSIRTTVSGSGSLTPEGLLEVELPATVTLEELLVEAGEVVEEGRLLATVDISSALSSLKDLQEKLDQLDQELKEASGEKADAAISAGVAGRVKLLYAQEAEDVSAVMAEQGALMVLSLDGFLAAEIPAGSLTAGDTLTVTDSQGTELEAAVEKIADGMAVILVSDNGPLVGDTVTAGDGAGTLYIHQPLKITGYTGTVRTVHVKENTQVYSYTRLLTLADTEYTAGYDQLLTQRGEMEALFQTLIRIHQDGGIRAPRAGTVSAVETLSALEEPDVLDSQVLLSLDPGEQVSVTIQVDESHIQSLEVGQEASITVESVSQEPFTGVVSEIDKTASSSGGVTRYTATITLDRTGDMLSGMSASVAVTIQGVEDALIVPEEAVRRTRATSYVYTTYDPETGELGGMVEVTTGLSNGDYIEILTGLSQGDTIYYTEEEETFSFNFSFDMGGGMPGGGGMPSGGGMPGGGGGGMPGGMGGFPG